MTSPFEPFVTAQQAIDSGLFPDLTEERLRHYVRNGVIRAYGPGKNKTYLLSEIYEDWKNINRRFDGPGTIQKRSTQMGGRLQKAWRKVP